MELTNIPDKELVRSVKLLLALANIVTLGFESRRDPSSSFSTLLDVYMFSERRDVTIVSHSPSVWG
jgi:hypothetical protein